MASRRNVSLKTIAEAARVSSSTVSLVLNNRGKELRISPETQQRICRIASELGYFDSCPSAEKSDIYPDLHSLNQIIVFITSDFQNLPLSKFNAGLEQYVKETSEPIDWSYHTYDLNHLSKYRSLLSSAYYKGAIITTPSESDAQFLTEAQLDIPVILYNSQINGFTSICHNDYDIGRQAADVFIRRGKKKIGIVVPSNTNRGINLRLAGFTSHLAEHGLASEQIFVATGPCKDISGGYIAVSKMLEQQFIPSAIYVINDLMTGGVINRLTMEKLHIPDDVELLSYGNMDAARMIPSVSSYISETEKMAFTCMEQLIAESRKTAVPGRYFSFGTECIWRESCPPPEES